MAAYAALVSSMNIINNLQLHPRPPISLHKKQVESLTEKLTFLEEFLQGYNPHLAYSTEADPLESRITDAAYAAEDAIESHIVDQITSDGKKMSSDGLYEALEKVIEEMALIQKEAIEIKETHKNSTPPDSLRSSSIGQKSRMVGADDAKLQMMDKLTAHRPDRQIIPIVGMGGSGKTTLAINVYQDRLIKEHFHISAWATISQEYSIPDILVEVLRQLNQHVGQNLSEEALGDILYKYLFGRKYLIIMDDMWSIDAWDRVRNYFPDNKNGSRIVVTTRLSNLASKLPNSTSLEMKLLDEAESWDLLSKTVFGEEGCPVELEEIGKKIGKSCKGLPLSIVVVGGLLAKSKHTRELWEYIEENLNSIVNLEDDERCFKILYMSYKQLPIYLKPCFLYMGVFPEDKVIRISELIKLWVAEGFLKHISGKSLEEIAKEYLEDLIGRNLVLINKIGSTGNIKCCKIHDLLRDLCLREAQKEKFYTTTPEGIENGQHRIVISGTASKNAAINAWTSMSLTRSLIWHLDENEVLPPLRFRLLRILYTTGFLSMDGTDFLENIHQLVNSRFLNIWVGEYKFPSSIWLFWDLQTLFGYGYNGVIAPTDIWYMSNIRHVRFGDGLHLPDPPNGQDDIVLGNLQTLGTIKNFKCSEQVVKRIPNIQKLKISYDEQLDDDRFCLTNLDRLDKLESLSCRFCQRDNLSGPDSLASLINFPGTLNKLTLENYPPKYCWNDIMDNIGVLPLLQKLKLGFGCFREEQWETKEGQFRSLKYLGLFKCLGPEVWTTASSHFPCLEQLVFFMSYLKEIPLDFAEISTLRVIHVNYCTNSAVVSAKRILEEQEELYGEATLQVYALLDEMDDELKSLASPNFHVR